MQFPYTLALKLVVSLVGDIFALKKGDKIPFYGGNCIIPIEDISHMKMA